MIFTPLRRGPCTGLGVILHAADPEIKREMLQQNAVSRAKHRVAIERRLKRRDKGNFGSEKPGPRILL